MVVITLVRLLTLVTVLAPVDRLLTLPEVADHLRIPLSTLYGMRSRGEAPRGIRVGRHIRVEESELLRWISAHADPERQPA